MEKKRAIALGFFDGLHVAHRAVLEGVRDQGSGVRSSVSPEPCLLPSCLLFDEHPLRRLRGSAPPQLLTDEDRDAMLRAMGLEILKIPFREIMLFDARRFFEEVLLGRLHAGAVSCGYHYHFGHEGAGDAALLRQLCAEYNVSLTVVPKVEYKGEAVSSTRIRAELARGNLGDANAMLGRPFGYTLEVVEGEHIGRTLGAPTLNQRFPLGFAVPKYGVYASQALAEGAWRASVTNIGVRPCFGGTQLQSETHILAFSGDLYGARVPVRLLRYLRVERRFASLEELKEQIGKDIKERDAQNRGNA